MAVIQISRVQVRRGQTAQTGFPQLASGEFGWSIDQQQLFIGNGAVSEGAPQIGNTRILTEHDTNFFLVTVPSYIYKNSENGPLVQTGPNSDPYVLRLLQDKLDDRVTLRDFGAAGDNTTDDTLAIQRAFTYCAYNKKALDLNEGTFLISGPVYIPPYAELRGAGVDKTIFKFTTVTAGLITSGATVDGTPTMDIASASLTPRNISINDVTFSSTLSNAQALLTVNSLKDSFILSCKFIGNTTVASTSTIVDGINFVSQGAVTCDQITIRDNIFSNLGRAIGGDYDVTNVSIYDNQFINLDEGIIFAKNLLGIEGSRYGGNFIDITSNSFNVVNNQAVYFGSNQTGLTSNISSNNTFVDVGIGYGNTLGELAQATEIMTFKTVGNVTTNDVFYRLTAMNSQPLTNFLSIQPIIKGPASFIPQSVVTGVVISSNTTNQIFAFPRTDVNFVVNGQYNINQIIELKYSLSVGGHLVRRGIVTLTVDNSYNTAPISDDFTTLGSSDGNLVFTVDTTNVSALSIKATNSSINDCSIDYSVYVRQ